MSNWKSPVDELNQYQKNILPERTCPECGKKIVRISFNDYAYRRGNKIYCSWTCYRKQYHRERGNIDFPVKNTPTSSSYGEADKKRRKR